MLSKLSPFASVLLNSYRNQLFSLLMLMCSLIIASAGLSAVLVINESAKQSYSTSQQYFVPNVSHHINSNRSQSTITKNEYAKLRRLGFSQLVAVGQFRSHVYIDGERISQRSVDFTGVDTSALLSLPGSSNTIIPGDNEDTNSSERQFMDNTFALSSSNQMQGFLHPTLYQQLLDEASTSPISIALTNADAEPLPSLQPLQASFLGNDIVMDMSVFYAHFEQASISRILVVGELNAEAKDALLAQLPSHLSLVTLDNNQQGELTQSFHLNLLAMALLMFVVCLFIVLNAAQLLINKRMPWLKVTRQLGISRRSMLLTQLVEMSLLGAVACITGVFLGVQLALLVSPAVQATLEGLYRVEVGFGNINIVSLFVKVYSVTLLGSLAAFLIPLQQMNQKLAHKNVTDASWQTPFRQSVVFTLISVGLAILAFCVFYLSSALGLLLTATACLILAGCALLIALYPYLLKWLSLAIPARFTLLKLTVSQSRALSNKTKIACCAFFIASTSNIGMNLMVDSFRGATQNWLSQRLVAEHYVYYQGDQNLVDILAKAGLSSLDIMPRYEHEIRYKNKTVQVHSYPVRQDYQSALVFAESDSSPSLIWSDYQAQRGIFVNQQFAIRNELSVGDSVAFKTNELGLADSKPILGIYYDYGNPIAQVLLPLSAFEQTQNARASTQIFPSSIYALHNLDELSTEYATLMTTLQALDIDTAQQFLRTDALLALSMQTFDRTFIITDGLNLVTLLVAALSLACAIVVLMEDVRPQRMLVRSFGVSRFKNQLLAYFQYILLCLVALLLATPFGILLSWVLIYEINYQAFQWTYPLQIDWLKILTVYSLSLLVVTLIIALPIFKSGRKPLIDDIRYLN